MSAVRHIYTYFLPSCLFLATAVTSTDFTVRPEPSYILNEGRSLSVSCSAGNSTYQEWHQIWEINGTHITPGLITGLTIVNETELLITPADHLVHTATYSCAILFTESLQLLKANFTVTVHYIGTDISLARIHQDCAPDNSTAYIDSYLVLECIPPTGQPMVNITWYLNDNKLRAKNDPRIDFSMSRRIMKVGPLIANYSGSYHCVAANTVNEVKSELHYVKIESTHVTRSITIPDSQPLLIGPGLSTVIVCKILPSVNNNSVRWYLDGERIHFNGNGSNTRFVQRKDEFSCLNELYIDNMTAANEGIYSCLHMGTKGVSDERRLILASLVGPLLVEANTSLVGIGRQVKLVCRLDDNARPQDNNIPPGDLVYSWTHNGSTLSSHVEALERGRVLLITADDLSDSGCYKCNVTSPPHVNVSIAAYANITVEASPKVSISLLISESTIDRVQDNMVYVELGAQVTLECTMDSQRNLNFTWYPSPKVGEEFPPPSLSSRRTLPRLTEDQLTDYYCMISDSVHYLKTSVIRLVETDRPYIRDAAAGIEQAEFGNGSVLVLVCEVRGGPASHVTWLFVGEGQDTELTNQTTGTRVEIVSNSNNSTLTKYGVTTSDKGKYICVGMESRRTFNVTITVPGKIEFTSETDVTITTGGRVQFDCVTSGIPKPTVNWLFDSQPLESDSDIEVQENGSLVIKSASPDHDGTYYCYLVDNREEIREFTLTVEDKGGGDGLECGDFSGNDCTIMLAGGAVVMLLLLLAFFVLLICVCILCQRWRKGFYTVPREQEALELKRPYSSRSSIGKDNGAANGFSNVNDYISSNSYGKTLYPTSLAVSEFNGTMLSEMRSVTPPAPSPVFQTPGTGCTGSLFSTDDQSSLTATLPNFPRSQLKLGEEIGEGEFGPVILGVARNIVSHEDTTQVVAKVLVRNGDGDDQFQPDLALADFANQMKIDYEHIACILGLCTDTEPYYVLYEYLDQGDMKKYLMANRPVPGQVPSIPPHTLSRLVLQVADGMAFLFSQRIIHGDLATRNCLISSDHLVKIADLGIGHDLYQTDYYDNGLQLLPIRWMPPELLAHTEEEGPAFSLHSDIWSFGVLCWEIFTFGQLPFEGLADEEVLERVPQGHVLTPPSKGCPQHLQMVMRQCWQRDPEARPLFSTLCMEINIIGEE